MAGRRAPRWACATTGGPIWATARLLPAEEAGRVAGELARKYPLQHRLLSRLLHRTRRWQMLHYELLA